MEAEEEGHLHGMEAEDDDGGQVRGAGWGLPCDLSKPHS